MTLGLGSLFAHLYRKSLAGDGDDGTAVEIASELVAVHCGAHEDQLQVGTLVNHVLQDGQEEIGLHTALVDLRNI